MKWLILAETYREMSNGVKIMHQMCDLLNKNGEDAYMLFHHAQQIFSTEDKTAISNKLNTPVITKQMLTSKFLEECIVVYPEVLNKNPLGAKKIVRFLGNKPGYCNNILIKPEDNAYTISHSKIFSDNANYVLFNSSIDDYFFQNDNDVKFEDRNIDLIYYGKGIYFGECKTYENTFFIDRNWPKDRKQLSLLLKKCRFFYTYDSMTQMNAEAIAAGAVPIFLRCDPWKQEDIDNMELGVLPRGQIKNIENNNIYGEVDYNLYKSQRSTFLNKVKQYEDSYQVKFKDMVEDVKKYFQIR